MLSLVLYATACLCDNIGMIATLSGRVSEKLQEQVVLDVGGVGYGLLVTSEDYGALSVGKDAKLYVHEHIRDDSHDLFGFTNLDTKKLFELLLSVNGVGPKMALNILSIASSSEMRKAIAGGDAKFIQAANGVGKKVAERVVMELKDKVGLAGISSDSLLQSTSAQHDEAAQALIGLGYSPSDAVAALQGIDNKLRSEERVKQALKGGK